MDVMRNLSARLRYATTYIEKAIEWSARVAEGDYGFAIRQMEDDRDRPADAHPTDEARAAQLLAGFFRLVEGVREREDSLKREVRRLRSSTRPGARDVDTFTGPIFARLGAKQELRRSGTNEDRPLSRRPIQEDGRDGKIVAVHRFGGMGKSNLTANLAARWRLPASA
jgi:hypothetical protein